MANFPTLSIQPNEPLSTIPSDTALRTETEADYVRSRKRTSRTTEKFNINYSHLTNTDYQTLLAFYIARGGSAESFTWVQPITSVSYDVRFARASFTPQLMAIGKWNVSFNLEEV